MVLDQNVDLSNIESQLYIFEDNEDVIKMIIKGRSSTMRHVSRTHRVALDWLFDRINLDPKFPIKYVESKNQLADILATKAVSRVMSGTTCSIHMTSMLRKGACSASIHDLAHIPTQNCLADCLTKASAKADNLITAVTTGSLSDVDIHPDFFLNPCGAQGLLVNLVQNIFAQGRRKSSS